MGKINNFLLKHNIAFNIVFFIICLMIIFTLILIFNNIYLFFLSFLILFYLYSKPLTKNIFLNKRAKIRLMYFVIIFSILNLVDVWTTIKFTIIDNGIHNEVNLIMRFLYGVFNNYSFLIVSLATPFILYTFFKFSYKLMINSKINSKEAKYFDLKKTFLSIYFLFISVKILVIINNLIYIGLI